MRNRQPQDGHPPQQAEHIQLSPGTVQSFIDDLSGWNDTIKERGAEAARLLAESQQDEAAAEAMRTRLVKLEQEFNRLKTDFEQKALAAREKKAASEKWAAAQAEAIHRADDLKAILARHAPSALDAPTSPQGQPAAVETTPDVQPGDVQSVQGAVGADPRETAAVPVQVKGGQRP